MTRRLAEVARKVGVSEATVSRVLNEQAGRLRRRPAQAVLTALDVLGYERPSKLRGERARLVGLVLPELSEPHLPGLRGGGRAAPSRSRATRPSCAPRRAGGVTEADYIELLLQHQVSGVVFAGGLYAQASAPHGHYARLSERQPAHGARQRRHRRPRVPVRRVRRRRRREQAMGHLVSLGHTRIGLLLGPPDHVPSNRKLEARSALRRRSSGIPLPREPIVRSLYSLEAAQAAAVRLLRSGVTGIACAQRPDGAGRHPGRAPAGLEVPADVSIVGYDDSALMNCTDPPLTTVRQPIEAMGRMVIELLVAPDGGHGRALDELRFEPELVGPGSTGPVSAGILTDRASCSCDLIVDFLRSCCRVCYVPTQAA